MITIESIFSTRPNIKRFSDTYFSNEEIERVNLEREERKFMLTNQLVGQKTSSEIRQILRHKKKYDTEL